MKRLAKPLLNRRHWIALAAVATLPACVVAPYGTYYRPETPLARAEWRRANCQGKSGPQTGVRLDLGDGLFIEVRSVLDRGDTRGLQISLAFTLPARTVIALSGPVALEVDGQPVAARFTDPSYGGRAPGPGDRWQQGEPIETSRSGGRVELQALVPQPGAQVRLSWPAAQRNGQALVLPELVLRRRSFDGGVEPFNC
ncbi:MAG: hypothetical protein IBJ04_10900 [Hydrogenophaga sp.]|uniref:hypothetical protein n=1 Tax=Hydrogenophaga sp. TaxID=1904254 RepID=UPI00257DEBB9|nr:hypothetical protein [Hydrogenophaga sp.]MBL0944824.1 hypothetical protein [Hydrogenophaga sp.]